MVADRGERIADAHHRRGRKRAQPFVDVDDRRDRVDEGVVGQAERLVHRDDLAEILLIAIVLEDDCSSDIDRGHRPSLAASCLHSRCCFRF